MTHEITKLGIAFILSGPSGAGKTSIYSVVKEQCENISFSVSCTTRQPRPGEVDGKDYHFIDVSEFEERIKNDEFIEYATVYGNYYGTLRSEVVEQVQQGVDVILDIDIQGAMQIKERCLKDEILNKCTEFIFIAPPSYQELERRLRARQTESEETILKRLSFAKSELDCWNKYDYLVINDDLEQAIKDMYNLFESLHQSTKRMNESVFYV